MRNVSVWIPNLRVFVISARFDQQHIESTFLRELQNPSEPPPFIVDPGGRFTDHQDRLVALMLGDINKPNPLTIQIPIPGLFRRGDSRLTLPTPKGGDSYEELTEVSFTRKGFAKSPLATRSNSSLWLLLRNMSLSQFTECVNRKDSPNGERLISPSLKLGVLRRI